MAERTLTISSLGKTFSVTGWKVGWASGPAPLVAAVRAAKQFLTFAGATPFQYAGAAALRLGDGWYAAFAADLQAKRDHICAGLAGAGFAVAPCQGTYFVNADVGTRRGRVRARAAAPGRRRRDPDLGVQHRARSA